MLAIDQDMGPNGEVEYHFSSLNSFPKGGQLFQLNSRTGEFRTGAEFLKVDVKLYKFIIEATDSGNPKRSSFHVLDIFVTEDEKIVQNENPMFDLSNWVPEIALSAILIIIFSITTVGFLLCLTCCLVKLKRIQLKRKEKNEIGRSRKDLFETTQNDRVCCQNGDDLSSVGQNSLIPLRTPFFRLNKQDQMGMRA